MAHELVDIDLTDDERQLLYHALNEYGGPIRGQAVMMRALDVSSRPAFDGLVDRLRRAIWHQQCLVGLDWARAVFLAEVSWASDVVGAGLDFATTAPDAHAAPLFRSIQRKLSASGVRAALLIEQDPTDGNPDSC
jgi:hypothetical protein